MKLISPPKNIYIASSKITDPQNSNFKAGKGVFALKDIKIGEIIEIVPILVMDFQEFIDTKWNKLFGYYFWLDDFVILALGYGSLYNHSKNPNAKYEVKRADETITFTALRNIKKDEEILFDYSGSSGNKAPLWFER